MFLINFWEYELIWGFMVQFSLLMISIVVANIIIKKVPFMKKTLLPCAVLGGLILLGIKSISFFEPYFNSDAMEMITYHTLALGFIALTLKKQINIKDKTHQTQNTRVIKTGLLTVNTYLLQGIIGILVTALLVLTMFPNLFEASGLLLPLGFGQGSGQALNFGSIYEETYGFEGGANYGLSIAGIGFLCACLIGVVSLNIAKRKNLLPEVEKNVNESDDISLEVTPDEIGLSESVDKFTIQISFVVGVYFVAWLLMFGISEFSINYLGDFGEKTVRPLIYGFNFLFGVLIAILFKIIMKSLKRLKFMEKDYINNYMLNRVSGFMFDLMIVAGIGAIKLSKLKELWVPLMIICTVGGILTYLYLRFACKKLYPKYEQEAFYSMFGMLTGTASTGMILLREVDPKLQTPAATNLALQNVPAMLFGFPLMFLIPFAAKDTATLYITLGVITLMFAVYNFLMFYRLNPKQPKMTKN